MEINNFLGHLYLLKKNYSFKKVYINYGYDNVHSVVWAIKKNKKIRNNIFFSYKNTSNLIDRDYDISIDSEIKKLYVVDTIGLNSVSFISSYNVWLDLAYKTITFSGISNDEKINKLLSVLENIPNDKLESFIIRIVYGFKNNAYNNFLLDFLIQVSPLISEKIIIFNENLIKNLPEICQFYDKFRHKFSKDEIIALWLNLIKKERKLIIDSGETHSIARYLINIFDNSEIQQMFSAYPLIKEKINITNNIDNPFEFEKKLNERRFLFEFNNEQMLNNFSTTEKILNPLWGYTTFKKIADKFLNYISIAQERSPPIFISNNNDPIYSAIVYSYSNENVDLLKEYLMSIFNNFFIELSDDNEINNLLIIDQYLEYIIIKVIFHKNMNQHSMNDNIEITDFKI